MEDTDTLKVRTATLIDQLESVVELLHAGAKRVSDAADRLEAAIDEKERVLVGMSTEKESVSTNE